MKIYFDMNIYNRIFDDESNSEIQLEASAIDFLFELIERKKFKLVWSFVLEYENSKNPFLDREVHIDTLSRLSKVIVTPDDRIKKIANSIVEKTACKSKSALHLASAIYCRGDYFLTCDDDFIRRVEENKDELKDVICDTKLYNPIDFLKKELDIDVDKWTK